MTTTYNTAAYCSGELGPGNIQGNVSNIVQSGLTTPILWALHIGRPSISGQQYGDLIFNDAPNLFVSGGVFNPNNVDAIAEWPAQVASLMQEGSGVKQIFFSIGGANPPVYDFTTIQYMLQNGMENVLQENFQALKTAFTVDGTCCIAGFDLDCEEDVDSSTIVSLCQILFQLGFQITFCPYTSVGFWQGCMQSLWNEGMQVSWWNLQCYAGGSWNKSDLTQWLDALAAVTGSSTPGSYLVPGLAVAGSEGDGQCPTGDDSFCTTFAGWVAAGLAGGFAWNYDSIVSNPGECSGATLADYVSAINAGLNGACD